MEKHEAVAELLKKFGYTAAAKDCTEETAAQYAPWIADAFLQKVTLINIDGHTTVSFPEAWTRYIKAVALLRSLGYSIPIATQTLTLIDSYERVKRYTLDYQEVAQ